jgi:hypothetical protein
MDVLSDKINKDIMPFFKTTKPTYKYNPQYTNSTTSNFSSNHYYDKEDLEIKELINQANQMINNTNDYNQTSIDNNIRYNTIGYNNIDNGMRKYNNKYSINVDDYINTNDNYNNNKYYNTHPNFSNNYNLNTISNYDDYRTNNRRKFNKMRRNPHNNYINTNFSKFEDNDNDYYYRDNYNDRENEYYIHTSRNYPSNRHNKNSGYKNYYNRNNNYHNNNVMLHTYQNIHNNQKRKDLYLENSENLYDNNRFPRKRYFIYTQPETSKNRNFSVDNNYKYENSYYGNRDNYYKNENPSLGFNTERSHRPKNFLLRNEY